MPLIEAWGDILVRWDTVPKKRLIALVRSGVPHALRANVGLRSLDF
jgi:hypothetical protein